LARKDHKATPAAGLAGHTLKLQIGLEFSRGAGMRKLARFALGIRHLISFAMANVGDAHVVVVVQHFPVG
jgi:hypothetical protein